MLSCVAPTDERIIVTASVHTVRLERRAKATEHRCDSSAGLNTVIKDNYYCLHSKVQYKIMFVISSLSRYLSFLIYLAVMRKRSISVLADLRHY